MSDRLSKAIRSLDAQVFARLRANKTAYEPSESEKVEWRVLFARVRQHLRGTVLSPAVFDRVVALAQ